MAIDTTLVKLARERLYTGVISDVLDTLGNWDHAMAPNVRPIDEGLALFGRARTGLYMSVYDVEPNVNPYEVEIALIDDLREDDVAVLGCPHGNRVAPWGELLSTASQARGAAGCVTDGLVRDLRLIREMKFPVFAGGIGPLDSKGRGTMMRMDVPIVCGGVRVAPGDWIFGDVDGVVVIPGALAEKTLTMALEKAKSEGTVRAELKSGHLLKDVFARHGIL
jgi:4-hydroxy-4-methyl-2-oxoglutarate aldolase